MNELFPIFLKVNQLQILLIGGGAVAEEKLHFLLKNSPNAQVHIVTKTANKQVRKYAFDNDNVTLELREVSLTELSNYQLIIAATNDPDLNNQLRQTANQQKLLLNVADKSQLCDFYLSGVVTKGDLKLAISTNGKSPIMARRLREFFEAELPENLDEIINELQQLRLKLNGSFNQKLTVLSELTNQLIHEN